MRKQLKVKLYLEGRNEVHQNDGGSAYISSYKSPMVGSSGS